tara:strand:+ start:472 stop:1332 length:861 start_codon:yes stop_codon:yes gene_type:complete
MNILVTGSTGFIGYDLIKILLEYGYKIVAIYRNKNLLTRKLIHKNLTWKKIDLKNKLLLKKRIDIIIHCSVVHDFSKKNNINDYINSNIISLNNLIIFAKRSKTKLIINFSTVAVYGEVNKKNLNEEYVPIKQNLLGMTKNLSEKILYLQPINFVNIRLPGVLCSRKNSFRPWLQTIINKIKSGKNVNIYNLYNKFNNVIDTHEIAQLILKIIGKKHNIRETFNLSATKPIKMIKIMNIIKSKYQSKSKIKKFNNSKNSFLISTDKIKKKLGFHPESTEKIILRNL